MKRSPMKPGKGFKPRTAPIATAGLLRVAAVQREAKTKTPKRLKSSRPRMTPIRKAARGQDCQMMIPFICNRDPETTVLAHSNSLADGKGMGLKAPDTAAAFSCSACHDVLDGRRPRPAGVTAPGLERIFRAAIERTHVILTRMGLIEDGAGTGATAPAPKQISLEQ
jgi:hypothetical protein